MSTVDLDKALRHAFLSGFTAARSGPNVQDGDGPAYLAGYVPESDAALAPSTSAATRGEAITARYTNWRGETAERTFIPHRVFLGSNEWHPVPQLLIEATDCEKGEVRTFAASGFAAPAAESAQVKEGRSDG